MADGADRKTKLAALRDRIAPVAKSDEILAVARELEAIGQELASQESQRPKRPETNERPKRATSASSWPRDMNESAESTSPAWGHDPAEDVRG